MWCRMSLLQACSKLILLAAYGFDAVEVRNTQSGKVLRYREHGNGESANVACLFPDDLWIASAGTDGNVQVWSPG